MRRKIYLALLTMPVLLMLLHSVTPHQHVRQYDGTLISSKCSDNLLSQIFQVDLGENHLEEFQSSRHQVDIPLDLAVLIVLSFEFATIADEQDQPYFIPESLTFQNHFLKGSRSLRAPPFA